MDGWAFGGALYATHDGASSWSRLPAPVGATPGYVVERLEPGAGAVWALIAVDPTGDHGPSLRLYRSSPRSDLWQLADGVPLLPAGTRGSIAFYGPHGWLAASTPPAAAGAPPTGEFFTTDDGLHWSRANAPCVDAASDPPYVAAASITEVVVACTVYVVAQGGMAKRLLYRSTDGGATFTKTTDPPGYGHINGLAFPSAGNILIGTSDAGGVSIQGTIDGGDHWSTPFRVDALGGQPTADLGFTDPAHGMMVAGPGSYGALFFSMDGGGHWSRVSPLG
jgi:photosystem II stability/assembly factor-like uncharacterized protein